MGVKHESSKDEFSGLQCNPSLEGNEVDSRRGRSITNGRGRWTRNKMHLLPLLRVIQHSLDQNNHRSPARAGRAEQKMKWTDGQASIMNIYGGERGGPEEEEEDLFGRPFSVGGGGRANKSTACVTPLRSPAAAAPARLASVFAKTNFAKRRRRKWRRRRRRRHFSDG